MATELTGAAASAAAMYADNREIRDSRSTPKPVPHRTTGYLVGAPTDCSGREGFATVVGGPSDGKVIGDLPGSIPEVVAGETNVPEPVRERIPETNPDLIRLAETRDEGRCMVEVAQAKLSQLGDDIPDADEEKAKLMSEITAGKEVAKQAVQGLFLHGQPIADRAVDQ
jgi:hypothetical protein